MRSMLRPGRRSAKGPPCLQSPTDASTCRDSFDVPTSRWRLGTNVSSEGGRTPASTSPSAYARRVASPSGIICRGFGFGGIRVDVTFGAEQDEEQYPADRGDEQPPDDRHWRDRPRRPGIDGSPRAGFPGVPGDDDVHDGAEWAEGMPRLGSGFTARTTIETLLDSHSPPEFR